MGKTKESKKSKKEPVEEVEMEEEKPKKDKKRKKDKDAEEAVTNGKEEKKKKKKKAEKEEEEEEVVEEEAPKKKKKKSKTEDAEEETPKSKKKKSKKEVKEEEEEEEEKSKKKKKEKKEKVVEEEKEEEEEEDEEDTMVIKNQDTKKAAEIAACESTKVFMSNLSFQIDDDSLKAAVEAKSGKIVSIQWMEDRETGKFKGSGIVEFESTEAAGKACLLADEDVLGRPLRVRVWEEKPKTPGKGAPREARPLSERPDNCTTVFCGNLSYEIDDDQMTAFFKDCGEVKQIRWLTDKATGDFKGCGFVEFYDSDSVDKAVKLNNEQCLGRNIRLDYSAPKPRNF